MKIINDIVTIVDIWFIDELERKFKTNDLWISLDNSFDSMFGLIKERTDRKEKI